MLVCWYHYFRGTYCYHLQDWSRLHCYIRTAVQLVHTKHIPQLYSWYPPITLHSCTVGTHQSHCTAVQLLPINHTAQLYSWYPSITLHSCTVGTHQSHCTSVQLVTTNHTAQLYIWYPSITLHGIITFLDTLRGNILNVVNILVCV